jgi:hypothetical protein
MPIGERTNRKRVQVFDEVMLPSPADNVMMT